MPALICTDRRAVALCAATFAAGVALFALGRLINR